MHRSAEQAYAELEMEARITHHLLYNTMPPLGLAWKRTVRQAIAAGHDHDWNRLVALPPRWLWGREPHAKAREVIRLLDLDYLIEPEDEVD